MQRYKNLKILLVDDDEDDYIIFKQLLRDVKFPDCALTWVSTFDKALEEINLRAFDVYFFDYLLGAKTGIDLIKHCLIKGVDKPMILLTGLGNHKTDMETMELGAADYLVKSELDAEKLERSIRYSIEQSRNLRRIKDSESKFRSIFENSHDIIYLANDKGEIMEVNKAAERLLGYTRSELLKMNAAAFYDDPMDRIRFMDSVNLTGTYTNFEVVLRDKFGNKKYCSITATVQKIDDNGNIYYQGIVHDMTRRKKAEQDLVIAEKLAVTGRVARTLAHEIRNPLTNINLAVEQLQEDIRDDVFIPYWDIIKRNGKRINDLISELMERSKPTQLSSKRTALKQVLNTTVALAQDRAALRNIKINTVFTGDDEYIQADESKLSMALLNIIINAVEATEDNEGIIKVSSDCRDKKCTIVIEDNGCGISSSDLKFIFEPYFSNKTTGTGLGLATAHSIITNHKGEIEVESHENKGTRFKITLNLL